MILVFLGPPGSGKGTQAQRLRQVKSWPHLSTGDLFRENIANKTKLGIEVEETLRRGDLVSDDLVVALVEDRTERSDCKDGYILDGFPRTLAQADALKKVLERRAQKVDAVVLFEISDAEVEGRMSSRRTCQKCGAVMSLQFNSSCPKCLSTDLQLRDDDRPETVRKRLGIYHHQTQPLVSLSEKKGLLTRIDATQSPDRVFQDLKSILVGDSRSW